MMTYMSKVMDIRYNLSVPRISIAAGITGAIYWLYIASVIRSPFGNSINQMQGSDFLNLMFNYVFTTSGMLNTSFFIIINCTLFGLLFSLSHNLISHKPL